MTEFSASQLDVLFAEAAAARNPNAVQQQQPSSHDSDKRESTKVPEAASTQSAPWQFVCQLWMAVRKQGVQRTSSKHVCSAACDWSQSDDFFVCKQSGNLHLCLEDRCEYRAASGERTVCTLSNTQRWKTDFVMSRNDRQGHGDQYDTIADALGAGSDDDDDDMHLDHSRNLDVVGVINCQNAFAVPSAAAVANAPKQAPARAVSVTQARGRSKTQSPTDQHFAQVLETQKFMRKLIPQFEKDESSEFSATRKRIMQLWLLVKRSPMQQRLDAEHKKQNETKPPGRPSKPKLGNYNLEQHTAVVLAMHMGGFRHTISGQHFQLIPMSHYIKEHFPGYMDVNNCGKGKRWQPIAQKHFMDCIASFSAANLRQSLDRF